jgi:hypothetical protein
MSLLTHERSGTHRSESKTGELSFYRPIEMARAVLPSLLENADEMADVTFMDAEDTLADLNTQAETAMHERGRVPRKVKRSLSRYAHRLLEITADEPDLHEARTFDLIGHAADATGERELLEITLEQARQAHIDTDTSSNLQAIEAALELDMPFADVMRTLNSKVMPASFTDDETHVPLSAHYDYLFDDSIDRHVNRVDAATFDDTHGVSWNVKRPLFAERPHTPKVKPSTVDQPTETML